MNFVNFIPRLTRISLSATILSAVTACGNNTNTHTNTQPPSPQVSVITIAPERLAINTELPGRLEATRIAEVRARATGIVLKRNFREGSDVKAGSVLFQIDPALLRATYEGAQAALTKAEANLAQINLKAERYQPLVAANAVSKQDYDDVIAAQKQAQADVAAAKATRQTASLNLSYATVTSPISGRIGRALVTEGALVNQGEATQLATVQQINPIYVNLTQSSTEILKLQQAIKNGQLHGLGQSQTKVTLTTEDGRTYPHSGKLLFSDLTVDASTGTVTLRAEFPNPDHTLLPGMYVRAKLEQAINDQAITVPQQAVMRDLNGTSVFVVGTGNKVDVRPVTADAAQNDKWIITQGLQAGEKIIVEGLQKVKPGAIVNPVPWRNIITAPIAASAVQTVSTSQAN